MTTPNAPTSARAGIEAALAAGPTESRWSAHHDHGWLVVGADDDFVFQVAKGLGSKSDKVNANYAVAVQPTNIRTLLADHDATVQRLEDELARVRGILEQIAQHGTHYDTMPTRKLPIGDAAMELDGWWAHYFMDADTNVRRLARAVLTTTTKD